MFNTVEKLFHPRVMTEWCQKCVNSTLLELHDLFLLDLSHRTGIDAEFSGVKDTAFCMSIQRNGITFKTFTTGSVLYCK